MICSRCKSNHFYNTFQTFYHLFFDVLKHVRNICITDFFVLSLQRINNKSK